MNSFFFLSSFLVYLCNGHICTSPVHNNSAGVTIRGPCPSSPVITPVGSTIKFECSYSHSGSYLPFWNITDIEPLINVNSPNSSIIVTTHGGINGYTMVTFPVTKEDSVDVQCGLCNGVKCYQGPLQPTVISLSVQLISFGK